MNFLIGRCGRFIGPASTLDLASCLIRRPFSPCEQEARGKIQPNQVLVPIDHERGKAEPDGFQCSWGYDQRGSADAGSLCGGISDV